MPVSGLSELRSLDKPQPQTMVPKIMGPNNTDNTGLYRVTYTGIWGLALRVSQN